MLGAGLAVYAEGADILEHSVGCTEFFRNESCGKCVPCRIGSQKLARIGNALLDARAAGRRISLETVIEDVLEMNKVMSVTSICGLGQVAGRPMANALAYFADEIMPPKGK
jgi:NADH:ubiquinone oxidoreductase subunit F (NADH-binding)